jgi:uncharacterized protein YlxW (UPF0749 family)
MPDPGIDPMLTRRWVVQLSLTGIFMGLGLLLVMQLRTEQDARQTLRGEEWDYVVADLIDSNARLREETETLQAQLAELEKAEGSGAMLQSLVDEVNHLRVATGMVEVSGPGVRVEIEGPITVLDLHDLINELRNAGAESLALNGQRIVAWSAISTDGTNITVDGQPIQAPYQLDAVGEGHTLQVALDRPGGLVHLLRQAHQGIWITITQQEKLTLPVYDQPFQFAYAKPVG